MSGYSKLFDSIFMSTVWQEDHATRIVWIALLGKKDRDGIVEGSIPGLAHLARVTIAEAQSAIDKFLAPDPHSRTPDYGGRRIEVVDGGWKVLNHDKYRDLLSAEDKRERDKKRQQRHRERIACHAKSVTECDKRDMSQMSHHPDTDPDPDADAGKSKSFARAVAPAKKNATRIPPDFEVTEAHRSFAQDRNLPNPDEQIEAFRDHFISKAGRDAVKRDWDATFRNWLRTAGRLGGNRNGNGNSNRENPIDRIVRELNDELEG